MPTVIDGSLGITYPVTAGSAGTTQASAAKVLQVVSSTKSDTFSTTTTGSWIDVTGLSVSITPTSSSSKIMIFARITGAGQATVTRMQIRLVRDSTAISVGDASGSRLQVSGGELYYGGEDDSLLNSTAFFLDSPATTSSTTYKIQFKNGSGTGTNVTINDSNVTSTLTLMEIAG